MLAVCDICRDSISGKDVRGHMDSCAEKLLRLSDIALDPFIHWKAAVALDRVHEFEKSEIKFKTAAQVFYDSAGKIGEVAKGLLEYSTLMDAFSDVARGRNSLTQESFGEASEAISKSSEILRSTIHFAFLAPYISACSILETVKGLDSGDEGEFESYRSADALLEQAKFALGFRDETHPLIGVIDALLKYSISCALHSEAISLLSKGSKELSTEKESRSDQVWKEYEELASSYPIVTEVFDFFPLRDFVHRDYAPLLLAYPDSDNLWIVNLGKHAAHVRRLGGLELERVIEPMSSLAFDLGRLPKGKIRVDYIDTSSSEGHSEGCFTLI